MSLINSFRDRIVAMVADAFPQLFYGSVYEYRITPSSADGLFDLVPVRTKKIGELPRVSQWGAPGIEAAYDAGASVIIAFLDADQTRPVVTGYMPLRGAGGIPTLLTINAEAIVMCEGTKGPVRVDDFLMRFWQRTGTKDLYLSKTPTSPYTWVQIGGGSDPPLPTDAGSSITAPVGSAKVKVG